ncbi:glycosyltransferase [Acetobacter musti]|uniref:Glycosyltransferase n=1 Tax=Acetobacter musti TaxID=864732 RepID=A0ABX0JP59_9PROT|nr:glycosyltransferase [Acetobacter musti]
MKVFVQLDHGLSGTIWRQRRGKSVIPGMNKQHLTHGYHHTASETVSVVWSEDQAENLIEKTLGYGLRVLLGFDFIRAWRNRAGILNADIVWTYTESQTLAVLLLLRIMCPKHPPKVIGQAGWLVDRWNRQPVLRRILFRYLLKHLDVLTVHSVLNLATARALFPDLRVEQIRFGIRADEMQTVRETCKNGALNILALGNDGHRDWQTLCEAATLLPQLQFFIASTTRAARVAAKSVPNVKIVRAYDNDSLLRLYNQADIVVVPLVPDEHVSGITVIEEAVIHGVPVIASDCGGLTDYFDHDCLTYVPSEDAAALASAIRSIQTDPEAARVKTERGQKRMRECINSVAYAEQHVGLSRDLLDPKSTRPPLPDNPSVVVGIATSGRAPILRALLSDIGHQTVRPAAVVICYRNPSDIEGISEDLLPGVSLILLQGSRGLPAQRNVILDHSENADIVLFLDDDFFPQADYIRAVIEVFRQDPCILGITGKVLADGARGPGYSVDHARAFLAREVPDSEAKTVDVFNTYGCNMAFRMDAIRRYHLCFDEKLPLYAWYEDMDFSRRLLPQGRIVRAEAATGVHLGSKSGKTSGVRLGYSQIANPVYLARKGTYPWDHALRSAGRHTLINIVRSIRPESWIDRRGRMNGNWRAWKDLLLGRLDPERISSI